MRRLLRNKVKSELFWHHVLALSTVFTMTLRIIVTEYVKLRRFWINLTENVKHTVIKKPKIFTYFTSYENDDDVMKEKMFFFLNTNEYFFQKALKNSMKQVWPKMEQQNYLRTIFSHALVIYGARYFHFCQLVCSHWQLLIQ